MRPEGGPTGTQPTSSMGTTMSITFICVKHMYTMNLLLFQSHYLQYASPIHGDEAEYELANAAEIMSKGTEIT